MRVPKKAKAKGSMGGVIGAAVRSMRALTGQDDPAPKKAKKAPKKKR